MSTSAKLLVTLAAIFLMLGCSPSSPDPATPQSDYSQVWRPKSSLSRARALAAANALASTIPGSKVYSIQETHSMEPILWGNFFLVAEKVSVSDIKRGDIVLYKRGSKIILHTCIGNSAGRLTMKGYNNFDSDNSASPNNFITEEDVVGRYVGCVVFDPTKP